MKHGEHRGQGAGTSRGPLPSSRFSSLVRALRVELPSAAIYLLSLAVLTVAADAGVLRVEALSETYGQRFCRVYYRTSMPCATRVVLLDGPHECVIRPTEDAGDRDHDLLLPLGAGRELSYAIVLPDGSRLAPRKVRPASVDAAQIRVRLDPGEAGGLDILASTAADANWTLKVRRGAGEEKYDAGQRRSPSARFRLPALGAEEEIATAVVTAKLVDGEIERDVGPIRGNRKLAAAFTEAVDAGGLYELLRVADAPDSKREKLEKAWEERSRRSGLAELLPAAASRAGAVLLDPAIDPFHEAVPFNYALLRVGHLDWLAGLRDWAPVTPLAADGSDLFEMSWPQEPPESSVRVYRATALRFVPLALYPGRLGGGIRDLSFTRLENPKQLEDLGALIVRETHPFVILIATSNRLQLAMWDRMALDPSWLAPDARVTVYLSVLNVEPHYGMYMRVNDRVLLPFRNRKESFKGSVDLRLTPENFGEMLESHSNWIACTVSSRFFKAGENTWVVAAENLIPNKASISILFVREIRIGPGAPPAVGQGGAG